MSMRRLNDMKRIILFATTLLFLFFVNLTLATTKTKLTTLQKSIHSIQHDLSKAKNKKHYLQSSLQKTEEKESHLINALHKTHRHISHQKILLSHLNLQSSQLEKKLKRNKQRLQKQITSAFVLSRQPFLKYLLEANSIEQYQHTVMDFRYLTNAQANIIKSLQNTLAAYNKNKQEKRKTLHALLHMQSRQLTNHHALLKTQHQRQQLIKSINRHINTKQKKLAHLLSDKRRLESTLAALRLKKLKNGLVKHPFSLLREHLSWPARGYIQRLYGNPINQSQLKWSGDLIKARAGTPVHAVAAGQVIFAKWMPGYGQLIIVDHGNGYMSLYGRNQSLLKKVGDWVTPKTAIATVGHSGGFEKNALYFALRHNAKPLNPARWCR